MCTLSASDRDVNPAPSPTLVREPVTYSAWEARASGSDVERHAEHWIRPPSDAGVVEWSSLPPWSRWRSWWPGSGLDRIEGELASECPPGCEVCSGGSNDVRRVELNQGLSSIPPDERRRGVRVPGLALTEIERGRLRSQLATVAGCGNSHAAYLSCLPGESNCTLRRLVAQRWCGTRQCPDCDEQRRKRSTARVSGPWRTFVTLGLPARSLKVRRAWLSIHRWIEQLAKALRDAASTEHGSLVRVDEETAQYCTLLKLAASRKRSVESPLDYAWCIEPHKSGYPHVHLCTTAEGIDPHWLRKTWRRITSTPVRWAHIEAVTNADGICRYLSKYVSKAQLPLDLLAILYRRRLWACTLPVIPRDREWTPESVDPDVPVFRSVFAPAAWAATNGWTVDIASPGRYATWSRPVSWSSVAQRLPESLADAEVGTMLWIRALLPGYARGVPYSRDAYVERVQGMHNKINKKRLDVCAMVA